MMVLLVKTCGTYMLSLLEVVGFGLGAELILLVLPLSGAMRTHVPTVAAGDREPGYSADRGDESRRFLQNKQFVRAAAMRFGRCGQCGAAAACNCPHLRFAVSRAKCLQNAVFCV